MAEKIEERLYDGDYPKDDSPYWREVSMERGGRRLGRDPQPAGRCADQQPHYAPGRHSTRCRSDRWRRQSLADHRIQVSRDTPNANQRPGGAYSQAADDLGIPYDLIDVAIECAFCWDPPPPPPPEPVPVPVPATEPGWSIDWGAIGVGALVVLGGAAVVACVATIICGATAAGVTASVAGVAVVGGAAVATTVNTPPAGAPES